MRATDGAACAVQNTPLALNASGTEFADRSVFTATKSTIHTAKHKRLARRMLSSASMDKTPCLHCRRVGLVRFEVVVKGREAVLTFYCGYCERTWQQADRRVNRPARDERSGRGRRATG